MSDWTDNDNYDAGLEAERQAEDDYQHEIAIAHAMTDRERDEDGRHRWGK